MIPTHIGSMADGFLCSSIAGAIGNDSCLPRWTLICYCCRAAVQHAAESRWQPGRSGGWGLEGREVGGGQERVAYVGGCRGGRWKDDGGCIYVCVRVCVRGGMAHSSLSQHPNIVLVKKNDT